ncbi:DUF3228 family protein [Lentisphaera profundi]|uniref:DUF3228 family protein n=1 Tax=Lentisphaera profundi TaxID=1658616 RepID=A0ABY7VPM0_9BACT|nr:DUF3228 family protein [Lentisphaera profundi]WDE96111.1 DUF3228 family protein [Lentisphaera profundi]
MNIEMCEFTKRQYKSDFYGTRVNESMVGKMIFLAKNPYEIIPGYADFCCIAVLKNRDESGNYIFPDLESLTIERALAEEIGAKLHCAYETRNDKEVAVLVDWVSGIPAGKAEWIHLILYSKEQMEKEGDKVDADWAIVSINGAATKEVEPMRPITAMRNALGVEEGGSGVTIDRRAYQESVDFWSKYIMIRREEA